MKILIYILSIIIIGSFAYLFFSNNYSVTASNNDQELELNEVSEDDDAEINRLVTYKDEVAILLSQEEYDLAGISSQTLTKKTVMLQEEKSALSINPKRLLELVQTYDALILQLDRTIIEKNYLKNNYNRFKILYETEGSIPLKNLEESKYKLMSINSEIIRLNKKLKERSALIKRSFGDFILKDVIGDRSVYTNLVNKSASIIAIENIEYENPNTNYFYKNKNLTFLTLNDEASKLFGNVGLFYLDGDSLSPERKITVYANTIDSMEGYFIPENALIYHNGKIWSYFKEEDRLEGLKLITSPWKRPAPDTAPFEAKASGPYIICTMSKQYAEDKGYKDALMLDYRGYVAEGTGANIFFIKNKDIHTPIPDCFLNGITRQTVIKLVKDKGFNLLERHILPEEINNFDEAFLTGTAAEITPIKSIDDINYNVGNNTITYELMNDFTKLVNSTL